MVVNNRSSKAIIPMHRSSLLRTLSLMSAILSHYMVKSLTNLFYCSHVAIKFTLHLVRSNHTSKSERITLLSETPNFAKLALAFKTKDVWST